MSDIKATLGASGGSVKAEPGATWVDIELDGVSTLVLAVGRLPDDTLFHQLRGRIPEAHCIGDALSPRPTEAVIYEAERRARTL